jgi:tetratricopeptide (TPR) repeat protein
VVFGLLAGGGVVFWQYKEMLRRNTEAAAADARDKASYDTAFNLLTTDKSRRLYDDAVKAGENYIASAINNQRAAQMYAHIGAVYEQKGDFQQALLVYRQAEAKATEAILAVLTGIGLCAYTLGDKQTALDYNRKAIEFMKATNDKHFGMDIDTLERINQRIEGSR